MTTNALSTPAPEPRGALNNLLMMCQERFSPVLGKTGVDWPSFALGVRAACLKNPALIECIQTNPGSLIQSLSQAAALELSPHPDLHHFYLVPFKNQIQALIGYRGLIELATRSGIVDDIQAFAIYDDEAKSLREAKLPVIDPLSGEPNIHPDNRLLDGVHRNDSDIVGAIAVVRVRGRSRPITHTMTRDQIEKRRMAGQGNTPAWKNWYAEQCIKTVIRAVLRSGRVPLGRQSEAIRAALEDDSRPSIVEVVSTPAPQIEARPSELDRRMAEPFPDEATVRAELVEDVILAADMAGIGAEALSEILTSVGIDGDINAAPVDLLRAALAKINGGEA